VGQWWGEPQVCPLADCTLPHSLGADARTPLILGLTGASTVAPFRATTSADAAATLANAGTPGRHIRSWIFRSLCGALVIYLEFKRCSKTVVLKARVSAHPHGLNASVHYPQQGDIFSKMGAFITQTSTYTRPST
jgi:hypothetical protein